MHGVESSVLAPYRRVPHTAGMTIKGFKLAPVAWMTTILAVLTSVEAVNAALHFLPVGWTPYLVGAIAVLAAVLGVLTHARVTPVAAPRDDTGTPLVPKWAAGGVIPAPTPPSLRVEGIGDAGTKSW